MDFQKRQWCIYALFGLVITLFIVSSCIHGEFKFSSSLLTFSPQLMKSISFNLTQMQPNAQNEENWLLTGDSTMQRLFLAMVRELKSCKIQKKASRCNLDVYLGIQRRKKWIPPSKTEGPRQYGLTHPYCVDCKTCLVTKCRCLHQTLEYLPVEFARDVTWQTDIRRTTQEVVAHYLSMKDNFKQACVINTGIHDVLIPDLDDHMYVENVRQYLRLLEPVCKNITWLSINAVKTDTYIQKNKRIKIWNKLMAQMIKKDFPKVQYFDVFPMSDSVELHADNVHMKDSYYDSVSKILIQEYNKMKNMLN